MAGRAVIYDTGMVERRRNKTVDVVADTTILIGGQVAIAFAGSKSGVMTGAAIVDYSDMIKARREKTASHMTIAAICVGGHMIERFADCRVAVMAGSTVIDNVLVVEVGVGERRRGMTDRAVFAGRDVWRIDLGVFAGGVSTVMTGRAVGDNAIMIKHRRGEGPAGDVADATVFAGDNMTR